MRQCRKYLLPTILRLSLHRPAPFFDKDGKLISERRGDKNAQYVKYEDIPKNFVAAIISIEDKKFYQHNGVDLKGLVRAVKATVMSKLKKIAGWYAGWKYDYHAACQADLYAGRNRRGSTR